jgi:hypothetical protein
MTCHVYLRSLHGESLQLVTPSLVKRGDSGAAKWEMFRKSHKFFTATYTYQNATAETDMLDVVNGYVTR